MHSLFDTKFEAKPFQSETDSQERKMKTTRKSQENVQPQQQNTLVLPQIFYISRKRNDEEDD